MARTLSLETRRKISQALTGRLRPESVRRAISRTKLGKKTSNGWFGKHHSDEAKAKISETRRRKMKEGLLLMPTDKRNPMAGEIIEKIKAANKGQRRSIEIRQKMSEAQKKCGNQPPSMKGVIHPEAFRERCRQRRGENAPWWGRHHSVETRRVLSEQRRGKLNSNWQGGITSLTEGLRHTIEFRLWREAIFARDDYTCQGCGRRGGRIHPHHIKSFARYSELRFDITNGVTLCQNCHAKTDNFGGRAIIMQAGEGGKTLYEVMLDHHLQLPEGKKDGSK
jgi:5-methylcytosine-specific restriction endonuclease McrA